MLNIKKVKIPYHDNDYYYLYKLRQVNSNNKVVFRKALWAEKNVDEDMIRKLYNKISEVFWPHNALEIFSTYFREHWWYEDGFEFPCAYSFIGFENVYKYVSEHSVLILKSFLEVAKKLAVASKKIRNAYKRITLWGFKEIISLYDPFEDGLLEFINKVINWYDNIIKEEYIIKALNKE